MNVNPQNLRVVLVTNMLPPYRVSFYHALSERLRFSLLLDTMTEFNRRWEITTDLHELDIAVQNCRSFVYRRFRQDVGYVEKRQFHFSEQTFPMLRDMQPDVVVSIEFGLKTLWSLLYGWIYDVPVILMSEGTLHTEGHVGRFKAWLRRCIVSQCTRYWSNGPDATALLTSYGADLSRIDEGMTGIDTDDWRARVVRSIEDREALRHRWNLQGRVLLFSGTLTPRKGVLLLLRAIEAWVAEGGGEDFSLLLLGDGEDRATIEEWCQLHPEVRVVMPGFIQPQDLPPFFAAADWAVLPTLDDNWPLATLETLVAGLPQLFSCYNGASSDLCRQETGLIFDPLDEADFVRALREFGNAPLDRIPDDMVVEISSYYSAEKQAERAIESFMKLKG